MNLDGPSLTDVINLLVAVGAFAGMLIALLTRFRKWQRDDMTAIVRHELAPMKAEQTQMHADMGRLSANQQDLSANQTDLANKFEGLRSSFAGHESRLSFLEGMEEMRKQFRNPPSVEGVRLPEEEEK